VPPKVHLQDIVVIGDPSNSDRFEIGGEGDRYGYEVNAMYIEALLNRTYFQEVPFWSWFLGLGIWCLLSIVALELYDKNHQRMVFVWASLVVTLLAISCLGELLILADYLPPIGLIIGLLANCVVLFLLEWQRRAIEDWKSSEKIAKPSALHTAAEVRQGTPPPEIRL
jgi:CHASE2 domain-containing sensor protein